MAYTIAAFLNGYGNVNRFETFQMLSHPAVQNVSTLNSTMKSCTIEQLN